eukprot:TRINITY_DN2401_c0_g1_i11.p2 TRINITY_DN2401_c0_g1~~TRINITY_DN2401_c0_g1_i11.p2  ORF type:complete len:106 (+),score=25.86 TRINITY_DN2401_c0_g1_i11:916-1233(+)
MVYLTKRSSVEALKRSWNNYSEMIISVGKINEWFTNHNPKIKTGKLTTPSSSSSSPSPSPSPSPSSSSSSDLKNQDSLIDSIDTISIIMVIPLKHCRRCVICIQD